MRRERILAICIVTMVLVATAFNVHADSPFSPSLTFANNYIAHGISQTEGHPAIQGDLYWGLDDKFYFFDIWGSNVSWVNDTFAGSNANTEFDLTLAAKLIDNKSNQEKLDLRFVRTLYPGSYAIQPTYISKPHTSQLKSHLWLSWFRADAEYSLTDAFGTPESQGTWYGSVSVTMLVNDCDHVTFHLGREQYRGHTPLLPSSNDDLYSYTDYAFQYIYPIDTAYAVSLQYSRTNANPFGYTLRGINTGNNQITIAINIAMGDGQSGGSVSQRCSDPTADSDSYY